MIDDPADNTSVTHASRESDPGMTIEWLPVDSLVMLDSIRSEGADPAHIRVLASVEARLPPIIVHGETMRVIDGAHRLGAARLRGDKLIEARMFEGTEQEAFVFGVVANTTHGLPLSMADRASAAERIITSQPTWSDRTIAITTGLGARTVSSIRRQLEAGIEGKAKVRIGRDGRVRPLDNTEGRLRAVDYLKDQPNASLREIAKNAGVSPSTARDVRDRIKRGDCPVPTPRQSTPRRTPDTTAVEPSIAQPTRRSLDSILQGLKNDPALRFSNSGRELLRWVFARAPQNAEWDELSETVPPHCFYLIADVARHCAQEWQDFADMLEKQTP